MEKIIVILVLVFSSSMVFSQGESFNIVDRKNVLKWNPTPMIFLGYKNIVIGYERVLKDNQSVSLNIGHLILPDIGNGTGGPIEFFEDNSKSGFTITADYRFYFRDFNKYPIPNGLYWGPYASAMNLGYSGESTFYENGITKDVGMDINTYIYSIGLQLGYQLLIKDRIGFDFFVLAPSYSHFIIDATIDPKSEIDEEGYLSNVGENLSSHIPILESILEDDFRFDDRGKFTFNSFFIRFGAQLSFAF